MQTLQDSRYGSFLVTVYIVHDPQWRNANDGPAYWVDVVDAPRQISAEASFDLPIPSDIAYPIWDRYASVERRVMDDFGNLARVKE